MLEQMLTPGKFHHLIIQQENDEEFLLGYTANECAYMLKKYLPLDTHIGNELDVFLYHDSKQKLIATNLKPKAQVGEFATLKVVDINRSGAFLDWGLPKDLFLPGVFMDDDLKVGDMCLVKVVLDKNTSRVIAKEKLEDELDNTGINLKEKDSVDCLVYKNTPIGYQLIVNGIHLGLLHNNEVFRDLYAGDAFKGFVKSIKPDGKIDIVAGSPGHTRVLDYEEELLMKLTKANGYLPYHDKTSAEVIYREFGMSKKTFKMTLGSLYRKRKIALLADGIKLA